MAEKKTPDNNTIPAVDDEFAEPLVAEGFDRRSFLKTAGFSLGAVALTGCQRGVVEKAIPYLIAPEKIVPGRSYWLATTCGACEAACGALIKCRDGRPIKLEGNPDHPVSKGGLCAIGQASVLELYDSKRLTAPQQEGGRSDWASVDAAMMEALDRVRKGDGRVRFLTSTMSGPATRSTVERFISGFADGKVVTYDPLSCSAILDAHLTTHGVRLMPRYRFDKADVVIGIDADFLGTWISPVEYTAGYSARRRVEETTEHISWHVQFESRMSLTGGKSDKRHVVRPDEARAVIDAIASRIATAAGELEVSGRSSSPIDALELDQIAHRLWAARGRSLLVCGSDDIGTQLVVNYVNHLLGSYGTTIDIDSPSQQRAGSDAALGDLVEEIKRGEVDAVFVAGVNPVYDLPGGAELGTALDNVPLVVSFAGSVDETAKHARFVCPDHHFLEAWRDYEPVAGVVAVGQPAIAPLGGTRSMLESVARWMNDDRAMYDIVRESWQTAVHPRSTSGEPFVTGWDQTLANGFSEASAVTIGASWTGADIVAVAPPTRSLSGDLALVLYPSVGMTDGRHAQNPWLYEMPDPITKVTWDNYASFSRATAARLGIEDGAVVKITAGGTSVSLPAHIQLGQHDGVVAIPFGFGREGTERFTSVGPEWIFRRRVHKEGFPIGSRVSEFASLEDGRLSWIVDGVTVEKTGAVNRLATTQQYHSLTVPEHLNPKPGEKRPMVQETTFAAWKADPHSGTPDEHHFDADMWDHHNYPGHKWGMAVDLSACTGCSGCVISCQAENNIPVVGKDEVLRSREMHWMRIDRYFDETDDGVDIVHQPMFCAHCENASCESVCPVVATAHSEEGLNQQIYNRCVGTRYCANNCAYKVRRFNWFNYAHEDRLQNMVLNPDVAVRTRGVMEKCSMCVQRIEAGKIEAKRLGVPLADGDIKTACQQSCPANAIVFGDLADPESRVSKARNDPRYYVVLGELNLRPSVGYMRIVRNRDETHHEEEKHV